jgi:hypothetical protein
MFEIGSLFPGAEFALAARGSRLDSAKTVSRRSREEFHDDRRASARGPTSRDKIEKTSPKAATAVQGPSEPRSPTSSEVQDSGGEERRLEMSVGATGFEPATSSSQSWRSSQAELRPAIEAPCESVYRRHDGAVRQCSQKRRALPHVVRQGGSADRGRTRRVVFLRMANSAIARSSTADRLL